MPHKEPEQPKRFLYDGVMPQFWPPKPHPAWNFFLYPFRRYFVNHIWKIKDIEYLGLKDTFSQFGANDGVLIAPNHSHEADAHILLEAARQIGHPFYFMAAWQAFTKHRGLDGWVLQRMGAFSVDREGTDRRSLRYAIDLLASSKKLVIFPEGEIHHLNDRLKPLLDGVAFIALSAQKQILKAQKKGTVWILPSAIRYSFTQDITPLMETAMKKLENRLVWWKSKPGTSLEERIIHFGEAVLTLKEKEKLGKSFDDTGTLPQRISNMINLLLSQHEQMYLNKSYEEKSTPLRVKSLRRKCIEILTDEEQNPDMRLNAGRALDDIQLALQLSSYPGNYIEEEPSAERMAETIEKYLEDIFGEHHSIAHRHARLLFGQPININNYIDNPDQKSSSGVNAITEKLEDEMTNLLTK